MTAYDSYQKAEGEGAYGTWSGKVEALNYACGSFSWTTESTVEPGKTDFDKLNLKVEIANPSDTTAEEIVAVLKAPSGFSFDPDVKQTRQTILFGTLNAKRSFMKMFLCMRSTAVLARHRQL